MQDMFFHFSQNNSGGSFNFDEKDGITHHVIIEAHNRDDAIERAKNIGIYFDGVEKGRDCECCGDRWYVPWTDDGDEHPSVYGTPLTEFIPKILWMDEGRETCVHYMDGHREWA